MRFGLNVRLGSKALLGSGRMQRGEQRMATQSPRWPQAGSVIGRSMPNDLAVVRWMTISEIVGCITEAQLPSRP